LFCALNGHQLGAIIDEAVNEMDGVAAGEVDELSMVA
jgi:hypothetical protein